MENYKKIKVLGKGAFGKVYLVLHKQERVSYALKMIKVKGIPKKELESTRLELKLLQQLAHPCIVGYKEHFPIKNGVYMCIVLECCDGGELAKRIEEQRGTPFRESKVMHWFVQMLLGLHYMHTKKVMHRDIKTANIFLLGNGRLVLGDLGICKQLDRTLGLAKTCIGTPYYMSPEMFRNSPYGFKSDVWALGCVLYEMATQKHPFEANSLSALATKIMRGKYKMPSSARFSTGFRNLVKKMLALRASARPDLGTVLAYPIVKKALRAYLQDIFGRTDEKMGQGTMLIREGARAVARDAGSIHRASAPEAMSLMKQLTELGLQEVVNHALGPSEAVKPAEAQKSKSDYPQKAASSSSSPASRAPVVLVPKADKVRRARRKAQEQLDRIEERKRNAEKALMRLKEERQQRKKRAEEMRQKNARRRRKDPGRLGMKPAVPRQNRGKKKVRKAADPSRKLPALAGAKAAIPELPPAIDVARAYRKPKAHAVNSAKDAKEVEALDRWEADLKRKQQERNRRDEEIRERQRKRADEEREKKEKDRQHKELMKKRESERRQREKDARDAQRKMEMERLRDIEKQREVEAQRQREIEAQRQRERELAAQRKRDEEARQKRIEAKIAMRDRKAKVDEDLYMPAPKPAAAAAAAPVASDSDAEDDEDDEDEIEESIEAAAFENKQIALERELQQIKAGEQRLQSTLKAIDAMIEAPTVEEDPSLREKAVKAVNQFDTSSGSESEEESDYEDNSFEEDDDEEDVMSLAGRIQGLRSAVDAMVGNGAVVKKLLELFRSGKETSQEAKALLKGIANADEVSKQLASLVFMERLTT